MNSGEFPTRPFRMSARPTSLMKANRMNALLFSPRAIALVIVAVFGVLTRNGAASAQDSPCALDPPCPVYIRQAVVVPPQPAPPSWIFDRSTYSHDPYTGARVAQYEPIPPVEPLDDPRLVTSRYNRLRTNVRGANGSNDTYYEVQNWGNGRGGLDAEWERFHDAWKESYLTGGYYNQNGGYYSGPNWSGGPYGAPGWGGYGYGYGGPGYGSPYPYPMNGLPGPGGPGGGNWQGNGGPQGGWSQGGPGGPLGGNGPHNGDGPHGDGPHGGDGPHPHDD